MYNRKQTRETALEWTALALFLFFPFVGYLPHPTMLLTAIVLALQGQLLWRCGRGKQRIDCDPIDLGIALLSVAFIVSGLLTGGTAIFEGAVRAVLLSAYFPTAVLWRQSEWQKRGAWILQISGGIAAFLGILQYFLGKAQLKWVDTARFADIGGRVTGGFENPNVFSVYLLTVIPFSLVAIFWERASYAPRLVSLVCLLAELLCLILTWSRGAWLGAMLVIFVFFLTFNRKTRRLLAVGFLPMLAASCFLPHNIINRFLSIGNLNESSIRYRLLTWQGVWSMICEHPFGVGLGYEAFSRQYLPHAVKGTETVIHTHQILLQILCELGILGLILFLGALFMVFQAVIRNRRLLHPIGMAGALALLGVLAAGLFDNVWYHHGVFCLFWIVTALAAKSATEVEERREKDF